MPADHLEPAGPESLDEIFGEEPPAPAFVPDRLARLYVVGVPLIFCLVLTGLAVVPKEAGGEGGALAQVTLAAAGLAMVMAGVGGTVLFGILRGPRGIGPSRYLAPVYVLGGLIGLMAYILLGGALAHLLEGQLAMGPAGALLATMIGWAPALGIALRLEHHGPRPMWRTGPLLGVAAWLPAAVMLPALVMLNAAVLDAVGLGTPAQQVMTEFQQSTSPGNRVLFVVAICIVAPVCEEMIFRGVLYRGFRDMAGKPAAVVGSALLFTAIHLAPTHTLAIFATGTVLALVYERTGTIIAPIALHAVHNTANLLYATHGPG